MLAEALLDATGRPAPGWTLAISWVVGSVYEDVCGHAEKIQPGQLDFLFLLHFGFGPILKHNFSV